MSFSRKCSKQPKIFSAKRTYPATIESKRILGIDPGSYHMGVGIIEKQGNRLQLLHSDTLHASKTESLFFRLEVLNLRLKELLNAFSPPEVAVEDLFFARNARSAFHLGMARGVAIGACLGRGIKIFEYAPTQVKSVVTGYGRADKAQVKMMIQLHLGTTIEGGFDASDALAIAICHASTLRLETL